ncbi:helix-turn-helix transcriptional regulator [Microlunatus soli]|uniref:AraC-type DNA-binding protein n=1 Tax=Microlunatus soli TaxID=630515 RepID=A0A1H1SM46_9ACTN|nr:AraC family transcriptional regulator [Microlunatus soli]SDS49094.1 AraC-type DNA-binding protein [Microlunatus soli]
MADSAGEQTITLPLQHPPQVINAGFGLHGVRDRVERWLLPELWALHLYDWNGELLIGDVWHRIRPGDLSIVPAGTPLEYRYAGPSQHIYAHFRQQPRSAGRRVPTVQELGHDAAELRARLSRIVAISDEGHRSAELWSVLWTVATRTPAAAQADHPAVSAAVDHIDRNLAGPLRVTEVARVAAISPSQLNRLFNARYRTSVNGYIQDRRLREANHLLRDTTQPISSIAASVGIADLQAFNKFCRTHFGEAPSKLRAAVRDRSGLAEPGDTA